MYNHGFGEHTELYTEFLPHFALAGYETIIYDQRGSGKTSPGKLYALTNERHIFEDLDLLLSKVFSDYPTDLVFLWGQSMGGSITLNYAVHGKYREQLAGYLGFAPMVQVHSSTMPSAPMRIIIPIVARILPNMRKYAPIDVKTLTSDEKWQKRLVSDQEKRLVSSASQMNDAFKRGKALRNPAYVAKFANKPTAVFHATIDRVNDFDCTQEFFNLLPNTIPLKKFYKYADCEHSLPQETPDRLYHIYKDVISFLESAIEIETKNKKAKEVPVVNEVSVGKQVAPVDITALASGPVLE